MASVYEILRDKDFQSLPYDEKRNVLAHFDQDFAKLTSDDQNAVMAHFNLNQPVNDSPSIAKAASEMYTPALQTAGAIGGGMASAALSIPTGGTATIPAVAIGSTLGAAAGDAAAKGIDSLTGAGPAITNLNDAATTTENSLMTGATGEIVGQGVGKAVAKIAAPLAKEAAQAEAVVQKARDIGVELSPAEVTGSKGLSLLESIADKWALTSDIMQQFRLKQLQGMIAKRNELLQKNASGDSIETIGTEIKSFVNDLFDRNTKLSLANETALKDNLLKKLGSFDTFEQIGSSAQEAIKNASLKRADASRRLYEAVDSYIDPNSSTIPKNLQQKAYELLQQEMNMAPSLRNQEAVDILTDLSGYRRIRELIDQVGPDAKIPDALIAQAAQTPMKWSGLQANRSRLGQLIAEADDAYRMQSAGQGTKMLSDKTAGVYKQLYGALEKDIDGFVSSQGPEAVDALDLAKSFYREGKETFDNKIIRQILTAKPEKVVDMVIKPGATSEIQALRKAVGPEGFEPLKKKFTNKLLETGTGETLSPDVLQRRLDIYGPETLTQVYSRDELNQLAQLPRQLSEFNRDIIGNKFFKTILDSSPEKVIGTIVKPKNTDNIKMVRMALGDKGERALQEGFLTKAFEDATNPNGNFSPNKFATLIQKYSNGPLEELYPRSVLKELKDLGEVAKTIKAANALSENPSGTAQNIITFQSASALIRDPIKGISIGVPIRYVTKAYLTGTGRQYLTQGFTLPTTSAIASQISAQIMRSILNESEN